MKDFVVAEEFIDKGRCKKIVNLVGWNEVMVCTNAIPELLDP